MMKRVDSPLSESMNKKPTSNSVKSSRKLSDQTRSHMLSLTMPEPSDSHTQILMKEIPLNTILKRTKSSAGSATNQDTSLTSLVVTTSVELDQSFTSKDIWAASILSTWRMLTEKPSPLEAETSSSLVTKNLKLLFQLQRVFT